ncbi:protein singed wings 2 [Aethina tumida]|uniref:protein singed wings 2 n=1 Tax=Aethina tumida TaxID=116153 RepID=UPI00096B36BA|nr:protein singed wings 2 [Aethina tumida]
MFLFYWILFIHIILNCTGKPPKNICSYKEDHLLCKKHLPDIQYPSKASILELHDVRWQHLSLEELIRKFPNVSSVTINGGSIQSLEPPMNSNNKIQILKLKHLKIESIQPDLFVNLKNLTTLNLEGNNIKELNENITFEGISNLYLSDNKWNCSSNLAWAINYETIIKDANKIRCHIGYTGKPLVPIAHFLRGISSDCPESCVCSMSQVLQKLNSTRLEPMILVNCSGRGLRQLPSKIPPETMMIHLENNDISNVEPLKSNKLYRSVVDIFLDNNSITGIEELEGTYWFHNFRVLSLSGNKLTELPPYALDNAMECNKNALAIQLSLGGNPWRCDCVFTPEFQELLVKYATNIKDVKDIKCSYVEGDENSLLPIIDLSRSSVCRYPSEYSVQEALDLLNAVLASLIVFVVGKLAYDYYHFKKTGRLPWIVTKIP